MSEEIDSQRQLAIRVAQATPVGDREALRRWAGALVELRHKEMRVVAKAKEAIQITSRAKVIWPLLKSISKQIKRYGWDDRSTSQRLGIGVAGTAFALFGPANAGIAALGGAVAVPLWVVFGAGAMFARHLYEELGREGDETSSVTYSVLNAKKDEK
jgi:hypothetical protein